MQQKMQLKEARGRVGPTAISPPIRGGRRCLAATAGSEVARGIRVR